jgi:hypothetical protein
MKTVLIRVFGMICSLVLGMSGLLPAQPARDSVPLLLTGLTLELRVDYDRGAIGGTARLELRNNGDRAIRRIPLLLNRLMSVSRITAGAGVQTFVQRIVQFQDDSLLQVNSVVVTTVHAIPPHDTTSMTVQYSGFLVGYAETGSLYIKDHVTHDFTIIREDAYAFPVIGLPSRSANRAAPREPFRFAARITVPADLVVAMGGEQVDQVRRDSEITWGYRSTGPVPFLNVTIAPYRVLENSGARIFYFPADSGGAAVLGHAAVDALERYARWFGPLAHQSRMAIMEIPEGYGSQASLTAGILQTADAFRERAQLRQLYHELSHLWNVADRERPSPRWNEGLASFLERRMASELDGQTDWHGTLERTAQRIDGACAQPIACDRVPFADYGRAGLTDLSYPVGAVMFYALYNALGSDDFDRAYRDFYQSFRDTGATSADLVAAFHRVSPTADRIFQDWFLTTRWYARLRGGESLEQIVETYRQP